jgi:uncharacterized membrane protein YheB (UPF0754 family)
LGETSRVDQKISECVNKALKKLGENANKSIYYSLEKDFNLERSEIPQKTEVFEKALATIFGEEGEKTIEKLILVEIRNTFPLKNSTSTFKEAVKVIRDSCGRV